MNGREPDTAREKLVSGGRRGGGKEDVLRAVGVRLERPGR